MVTSTFAHPYVAQVVGLWLSFLPGVAVVGLMVGAAVCGNRNCVNRRAP